jgi:nucleoside triphosphate diphosphatase
MSAEMDALLRIMAKLRNPDGGCPWDLQQNFASIAPYTIEEAYEVADAIDRGDMQNLREELGDLLLQVVFHAQMAQEAGHFAFEDVARGINEKMIRRHPHVFGDAVVRDAETQTRLWEEQKRAERKDQDDASALAGISSGLPEWLRGHKLQQRAARVGFEWPGVQPVLDKLTEEVLELRESCAIPAGEASRQQKVSEELGDVLFVAINVARHEGLDFGSVLRAANRKFETRFRCMEDIAAERQQKLSALKPEQQEALWNEAKQRERKEPQA